MNKVITDGITLMPPAFIEGLDVWSREDGRPGTQTYADDDLSNLVAADADFGSCIEIYKSQDTQHLRYMGTTPLLEGLYLRITAKVKVLTGPLPSVRVAGWPGGPGGVYIEGNTEHGESVDITEYGRVFEVSAIVGTGARGGVDMVWNRETKFGHFGLDFIGGNGSRIRVDDIMIDDVTSVFLRDMIDIVDVTDYGAIPDGETDNVLAFELADADANGRDIFVPKGVYYLASSVTMNNRVRFEGTIKMPDEALFQLAKNYDFKSYEEAFGNEELSFKKGIQALFNFTDHNTFDLCGRTISISEPIDVHSVVGNRDTFSSYRSLRNGELRAHSGAAFDNTSVTLTASYDPDQAPTTLSNINNISSIEVGSLVEGAGVGREVYVRAVNEATGEVTLSLPLYGAASSQSYTFTRFKYLLDFSGFSRISRFVIEDIDFGCRRVASGVMLPPVGLTNTIRNCFFTHPKDRAITSIGTGCAGLNLDENQFLSSEQPLEVGERTSVAINLNVNDAKVRNNRAVRFKHFLVGAGAGYIITGNHFFQGDNQKTGLRTAGIILTNSFSKILVASNYVDNCHIEWSNEHNGPSNDIGFSFSGLTISNNHFTSSFSSSWFTWIKIRPIGHGHYINGLNISDNVFKAYSGTLERVESIDTSLGSIDATRTEEFTMNNNNFINVDYPSFSPVRVNVSRSSASNIWSQSMSHTLPFDLQALTVSSVVAHGPIQSSNGSTQYVTPYVLTQQGSQKNEITLHWPTSVKGSAVCTVHADKTRS